MLSLVHTFSHLQILMVHRPTESTPSKGILLLLLDRSLFSLEQRLLHFLVHQSVLLPQLIIIFHPSRSRSCEGALEGWRELLHVQFLVGIRLYLLFRLLLLVILICTC